MKNWQKLLAPLTLILIYAFFAVFGNNFFSVYTLKTILESSYYIGFLAFGVTFVIIAGGIDLSIGTVMMCSALTVGMAYHTWGLPLWCAMLLFPLTGLIFGLLNGVMIAKCKLPPFIATLGTMLVAQGFGSILTNVKTQQFPTAGAPDDWFKTIFYRCDGVPTGIIFLVLAFAVAALLLNRCKLGRYCFAIGSNDEATRLSGVNTDKWKITIYSVCGLFSGLAGIFYAATYTTIIPGTGTGQEMNAISAVIIGGTSMSGGVGSVVGTLIGVFIMSTLKNGLSSMGLQADWQILFTGIVVVVAVLIDILRTNAAKKAAKLQKMREDSKVADSGKNYFIPVVAVFALIAGVLLFFAIQKNTGKEKYYISVISRGEQHAFWQEARKGCMDAAKKYNVNVFYYGPPTETDVALQMEAFKFELPKNPDAIGFAPLSEDAAYAELQECVKRKIPVVAFDGLVRKAPEGSIKAFVATNNFNASAIAARKVFENKALLEKIKSASPENPMVIGVIMQDALSDTNAERATGFIETFVKLAEKYGRVSVEGHVKWKKHVSGASFVINVAAGATSQIADMANAAQSIVNLKNISLIFATNEGIVNGLLSVTSDGADFTKGARLGHIAVIGFDAGKPQKNAVRNKWFMGAITQDPYQLGYQTVKTCYEAISGKKLQDVDTGAKWYDASNMDSKEIKNLLYD